MAVRLYSEFNTDQGDLYKIEIHDSSWVASSTAFTVDGRGFELSYQGETDDIISPIVSSRLTFGAYSQDGTFELFIDTLKQFQENRFRVVVYRAASQDVVNDFAQRVFADGGTTESLPCVTSAVDDLGGTSTYSLFWLGWITQDLINIEDTAQPYILEITATDGLGRMANIDYDTANEIDQNGLVLTRATKALSNAFNSVGTADLWGSSDPFLEVAVDWWETSAHTYSTSTDPFNEVSFDARLFERKDEEGNTVYSSALDVVRQLAVLFNARVFMERGRWVFEQYGLRAETTRYVSVYNKSNTALSRTLISDDITLNQTIAGARLAGNAWDFLPALRKISVDYIQRFLNPFNLFGSYRFNNTLTTYTAGFISGGSGIQMQFGTTALNVYLQGPTSVYPIYPVFRSRIRIKDVSTGTYYYYNRAYFGIASATTMYALPAWSTTAGYYYFDLPAFFTSGAASLSEMLTITTEDLPVSGELDITLEYYNTYYANNGNAYSSTFEAHTGIFGFGIVNGSSQTNAGTTFASVNNQANVNSKLAIELGEVYIADGPTQTGHLAAYNGSSWEATAAWRKGSTGTGIPILKLLTNEALALHVKPIQRYNGTIASTAYFSQRFIFDSTAYLRTDGTFTANLDEWDTTLYAIQRIKSDVTALDEVGLPAERLSALSSSLSSGSSPNDINAGRVGGMLILEDEQRVGPFQQITGGGRVNGIFNATGNATLDQKLLVDGGTVLGLGSTVTAFSTRVTTDGGTVEALSCVTDAITALSGTSVSVLQDTSIKETLSVEGQTTLKATAADYIDLSLTADSDANVPGRLTWNDAEQTVRVGLSQDVVLNLGEDDKMYVRNTSGATIAKGLLVMSTGISGNKVTIAKAVTDGSVSPKYIVGVLAQTLADNESGVAFWRGFINGIDTSAYSEGTVLWNNPAAAGTLSSTEPSAPNLKMSVAIVTKSNAETGEIYCRPWLGNKLSEIHDVAESATVASGDLIRRSSSGTYETFTPDYYSPAEGSEPTPGSEGSSPTIPIGTDNGNYLANPDKWGRISIGGTNYVFPLFIEP